MLSQWVAAHNDVRRAVQVWRWINQGVVSECLEASERGPLGIYHGPPGVIPWHMYERDPPRRWIITLFTKEADPEKVAMRLVQKWINNGLDGDACMSVLRHPVRNVYVLRVRPRTLLGCMWWQFARAFAGDVQYAACRVCGKPLERGTEAFMLTRVFCTPACKQ